jgi:hypothetical protein
MSWYWPFEDPTEWLVARRPAGTSGAWSYPWAVPGFAREVDDVADETSYDYSIVPSWTGDPDYNSRSNTVTLFGTDDSQPVANATQDARIEWTTDLPNPPAWRVEYHLHGDFPWQTIALLPPAARHSPILNFGNDARVCGCDAEGSEVTEWSQTVELAET